MKKTFGKRLISFAIAILMALSFIVPSFAEQTDPMDGADLETNESLQITDSGAAVWPEEQEIPDHFEAVRVGGKERSAGNTVIYIRADKTIKYLYPFSGGSSEFPAYIYFTADGRSAYCIEPAKFDSTNGVFVTGSKTFSGLSKTQQNEIARAIAANISGISNTAKCFATQVIIWEIAYNQAPRSGSVYKAVVIPNAGRLSAPYEEIRAEMERLGEVPSFMSKGKDSPKRHDLVENGGEWTAELTNTNSKITLNASDFKTRAPYQFTVSGHTLKVTSDIPPDEDSYTEWHSTSGEGALIFWNSNEQTKASFDETAPVPGDGYMTFSDNFTPPTTDDGDNGKVGYLTITKFDGTSHQPLGGAVFKVQCEGFLNEAFMVPYGGKTIVIPIPEGKDSVQVTVTEISSPPGFVLDPTPKTVTVTAGDIVNIAEISFTNYPADCSLTIYKHEKGNKSIALEGARFRIRYADANVSAQVWTETTDENGEIYIQLPAAGTLIIEELEAPDGYVMDTVTSHDITVAKGEDKRIDISNAKKSELVAIKKDAQTGQLLSGAIIRATLLKSSSPPYVGGQVFTQTTGTDGRAIFSNLIPGEYRVEEIQPPQYYVLNDKTVHTVTVLDGGAATVEVEFQNEPWTGLTIKKVDATDGHGLQGAIFKLYRGTAAHPADYLGDWQTNDNGTVVIQNLEPGYYTVVEAQAPYGYLIDPEHSVQTIEIKPDAVGKNLTIIFRNPPKLKILIEKIDGDTGAYLPGAVFHVAKKDGIEYVEVTTGSDGTVLLENLDAEWYTITEVRAPNGYVLDSTPKNIQAVSGKTVTVSYNNFGKPDLVIRKIDEQTGAGLPGAVFRVTKEGAKEYQDVTTNANGTFQVKDLLPGWYTITELQAPAGYILDETPHYIEVKAGRDTELIIKNRHKPTLEIIKLDSVTKQPLSGVKFNIALKNGANLGDFFTDKDGRIALENCEPGLYVIKETKAPDGYHILTPSVEALVEWGKVTTVELENQPQNPILVKKVDAKTGAPLAGAKFLIQKVNGEFVAEMETGRNGYITITGQEPGWYTVKEIKAPQGYILNEEIKTVELKLNEPAVVEFENQALNGLHIKKIDSMTKLPLMGAKFRVSEKGGKAVGEFTSDAQGEIIVDGLAPGWYTIEEIEAPEGYIIDSAPKDVEFIWGQFATVEFTNTQFSGLQVRKIDAVTKVPLQGIKFRLNKMNGEYVGDYTTNSAGFFAVSDLEPGWYTCYETQTLSGYILDTTPQNVEMKRGKNAVLEFVNQPLSGLQIRKVDDVTGKPISGVRFKLAQLDGRTLGEYTTDGAGIVFVPNLAAGWYVITEVKAPEGYRPDTAPRNIEIKTGELNVVEYRNQPYPVLSLKKVDKITKAPLEGAKYKLFDQNNREIGTFSTNRLGQITLTGMGEGTYSVQEIEAPAGYVLDSTVHPVLLEWGRTTILELKNTPMATLRLIKIDSVTKKPIYNTTFNLYDMKNNLIGEFTTDQSGIIEFPRELAAGKYKLKETKAADGYVLDATIRTIEVKAGETTEITLTNEPIRGNIQIIKKSSDYNDVTKLKKGALLEGAVFEIFDKTHTVVDRITTNRRGVATSKDLPVGVYGIREITAPKHYILDDKPFYVEIKIAGDLIQFEVLNDSEELGVDVRKFGNYEAMPGDIIRYDFEKIGNTSTVSLDDFYWRDVLPTDAVRLGKIVTGTWSERLTYEVEYKTSLHGWRTLEDDLSTKTSNTLDCSRTALHLKSGEYITEFRFQFGTVQAGFTQEDAPYILCSVNGDLPNEYRFTNKTDVGGKREKEWITAKDAWVTIIYAKPRGKLPQTGW